MSLKYQLSTQYILFHDFSITIFNFPVTVGTLFHKHLKKQKPFYWRFLYGRKTMFFDCKLKITKIRPL